MAVSKPPITFGVFQVTLAGMLLRAEGFNSLSLRRKDISQGFLSTSYMQCDAVEKGDWQARNMRTLVLRALAASMPVCVDGPVRSILSIPETCDGKCVWGPLGLLILIIKFSIDRPDIAPYPTVSREQTHKF